MRPSKYQISENEIKERRALELYKTGLSLRAVGKVMNKSHQWVKLAVDKWEKAYSLPTDYGV